ncbi:MAG TPA: CoA transferase [Dehalococcoidia bacterium]|nr:CoA transferase [Dehalococcoidia bacterium]
MAGALEGVRIIDFGQYLAGPMAALFFADQGADVIRIDPPQGPRWRHHANAILQRGKRSIALDLQQAPERDIARRLVETADVVIENFRPGVMDRLGLGADDMLSLNRRLIYCSLPGFSATDPRAGTAAYEGVVETAAALYFPSTWNPEPDGDPVYNALPLASTFAAIRGAQAIMAALIARERTGRGQRLEVPLFDATFEVIAGRGNRVPNQPPRPGFLRARHDFVLDAMFECADGRFVNLSWLERRQLAAFAAKFADPSWEQDGLLDEDVIRKPGAPHDELQRRLREVFKTRTADEWERLANPDSDLARSQTTWEWLHEDETARASGAVIEMDDPELGPTMQAGYPIKFSKTPSQARGPRVPLNADRGSILAELDAPNRDQHPAPEGTDGLTSALEGFRVIDLTQVLAGPTAGRILAEFGAEVVKINNPNNPGAGNMFYLNSGKRTMLVDLKSPDGMEILWRLIERSDVLSQNFSPQATARLGITEAEVRTHRPDIIYSSISCYGWDGPRATYRGHEQMGQAVTGMQLRWGQGFREPVMQTIPICDIGTGNFAALGIMVALFHRIRTGEGQSLVTSLSQTATYHQLPFMIDYAGRVWNEPGGQEAKGSGPLNRLYRGSDRWFFMAADQLGVDGLSRVEGLAGIDKVPESELETELTSRFEEAPAADWVAKLLAAGAGAHVMRQTEENMEDAWVKARGLSVEREFPELGLVRTVGPSGWLSETPLKLTTPAAPAGSHNREVLEELGLGERYEELMERRVLAESGRAPDRVNA